MLGKDALALNPQWRPLHRGSDLFLAGTQALQPERLLPVSYPFHLTRPLAFCCVVEGHGAGLLSYTAETESGERLSSWAAEVHLPAKVQISENEGRLVVNGTEAMVALPPRMRMLHGAFTFEPHGGPMRARRTAQLLRTSPDDAGYFTGSVYADYEGDPGMDPSLVLDALAQHEPLRGRLLDLGCATGLLVAAAIERGMEAEGVDASAWACERANARTNGKCRVLDLDTASAADFSVRYDFVTAHSVLEHVSDPARLLKLIWELLAHGGVAMIQTLNADSLMHRVQKESWSGYSDPTHLSPWITTNWLIEAGRSLGFEVVRSRTYGVWNDRAHDPVWRVFGDLLQHGPASTLLEEGLGDFVEVVLRKSL